MFPPTRNPDKCYYCMLAPEIFARIFSRRRSRILSLMLSFTILLATGPLLCAGDFASQVADLSTKYCHAQLSLDAPDPKDGDLTHAFVGESNYLREVCRHLDLCRYITTQLLFDVTCGDIASCFQKYQPDIIHALLRTGMNRHHDLLSLSLHRNRDPARNWDCNIVCIFGAMCLLPLLSTVRALVLLVRASAHEQNGAKD